MKKLLLLGILVSLLAACDDDFFPFHDEGWHGRGHWEHHDHGHGHYAHRGHGRD